MTFMQAATGADTLLKKTLMVVAGTILLTLAAKTSVPFWPVPMSMQTLAVLTIGLAFGPRLGAVTVLAWLAQGLAGLEVFAFVGAGPAYFAGPTTGFLVGFVAMAYVAGLAAGRGAAVMLLASFAAAALIYVPGLAWPMSIASVFGVEAGWAGMGFDETFESFAASFLIGDTVKAVLAVLAVTGAMKLLRKS